MKRLIGSVALVLLSAAPVVAQLQELKAAEGKSGEVLSGKSKPERPLDPVYFVNPFIGTGGHGHTFPGPVWPFGMTQPGPDTRPEGWDGCSGYHYSDSVVYGFSHTHLSGTGIPDYSDLLIVPQVGSFVTEPAYKVAGGYGAKFSHNDEKAVPGLYSVRLKDPDVAVRLTTTKRCGIHEYTFHAAKGKRYLLLDLGYRDKVLDVSATPMSKTRVTGYRRSAAWAMNQHFYFDLETSVPFSKTDYVFDKKKGQYVLVLEFPETVRQVTLRVGISGTDIAGATNNREAEATHWDFDRYMREAQDAWRLELNGIQIKADKETLFNFYTALYHAYVHPSLWTDVDGRYRDFSDHIQQSATGDLYSVFSLWDTYRAANPLYTITQPKQVTQFVESFRQQYRSMGLLPVWTLSNNETNCMIGYHSVSVIADAAAKGIKLKEEKELLQAMIATSNYDHFGKKQYVAQGFISASDEPESVSKALEYSYDDWCIAQFARKLGEDSIALVYEKRAANWRNVYHPESGFFQSRKGGVWLPNFVPNEVNHHFTEANAWQYSLAAPHHIASLTELKGGPKAMEHFLDSLFYSSSVMSGREQADITGLIGQYAHGNEPSHHMGYLYNYCGAPYKTQIIIDSILRHEYRNAPDGLAGNEDCGQMSAWYVLSSMGFYPVSPGSPTYAFGRPVVNEATITSGAKPFHLVVKNNSPQNKFIQSILWNGVDYKKTFITHEMIAGGGEMVLEMGMKPQLKSSTWETDLTQKAPESAITVPFFVAKGTTFGKSITVSIDKLPFEAGQIVYTVNGQDPTASSTLVEKDIVLYETTTLKARIIRKEGKGYMYGPVVETTFNKYVQDKEIALSVNPANQYAGGGPGTLIDGQSGGNDYRGTEWVGFQGEDVVATVTLNESKSVSTVTASCLQDTKSWIFHPKGLIVEVSEDGVNFTRVGVIDNKVVSDKTEGVITNRFSMEFPPVHAKVVRVTVQNYGTCPEWHLGAGGKTWTFLDELMVE